MEKNHEAPFGIDLVQLQDAANFLPQLKILGCLNLDTKGLEVVLVPISSLHFAPCGLSHLAIHGGFIGKEVSLLYEKESMVIMVDSETSLSLASSSCMIEDSSVFLLDLISCLFNV